MNFNKFCCWNIVWVTPHTHKHIFYYVWNLVHVRFFTNFAAVLLWTRFCCCCCVWPTCNTLVRLLWYVLFVCIIWTNSHTQAVIRIDHICSSFSPSQRRQRHTYRYDMNWRVCAAYKFSDIATNERVEREREIQKTAHNTHKAIQMKCMFKHPQVFVLLFVRSCLKCSVSIVGWNGFGCLKFLLYMCCAHFGIGAKMYKCTVCFSGEKEEPTATTNDWASIQEDAWAKEERWHLITQHKNIFCHVFWIV